MELRTVFRTVFRDLLPRLEAIALAGATSMKTTFVGGQKSLPVRYTLAAAG